MGLEKISRLGIDMIQKKKSSLVLSLQKVKASNVGKVHIYLLYIKLHRNIDIML